MNSLTGITNTQASAMLFAREGAKVLCADLNFEAASTTAQTINDAAGVDLAIAVGVNVANAGVT